MKFDIIYVPLVIFFHSFPGLTSFSLWSPPDWCYFLFLVLTGKLIFLLTPDRHKPSRKRRTRRRRWELLLLLFFPFSPALVAGDGWRAWRRKQWLNVKWWGRKRCQGGGWEVVFFFWAAGTSHLSQPPPPSPPSVVPPVNARRSGAGQSDSWPGWQEALKTI